MSADVGVGAHGPSGALDETQRTLFRQIVRGVPLRETLAEAIAPLERERPGMMASVLLIEGNRLRLVAGNSLPDGYNRAMDRLPIGDGYGSSGTAVHRGEPVLVADIQTDALWVNYREIAVRYGLRACWAIPIARAATNQVLGTFTVYHREPRLPRPDELLDFHGFAELAGLAIEHDHMRRALEDSERRFRELVDELNAMVWDTTNDARRFTCVSSHAQHALGVPPDRWTASPHLWQELVHPDDREDAVVHQREALKRPEGFRYEREYRLQAPNGRSSWVRDKVSLHVDANDGSRSLRGITMDITAQREAEREREQLVESLAKEKSLLRSVVQQLPEAVTIISAEGHMLLANRAAEETMNMKLDAAGRVQESYAHFELFFPDGRPYAVEDWPVSRALATGETVKEALLEYVAADGSRRCLTVNSAPVRDDRERIVAVVSVFADITDRVHDERLQAMLADAGSLLAGSRDEVGTARGVARLAVASFADWVMVAIRSNGDIRCLAAQHRDPGKQADLEALGGLLAQPGGAPFGIRSVITSGKSAVLPVLDADDFEPGAAQGEVLRLVRALGATAAVTVPLPSPAGVLGAMVFVSARSPSPFAPRDVRFAEELARRVALSLENAQLFEDARRAVRHREEFLSIAAHELKTPLASLHVTVQDLKATLEEPQPDLPYLRERVAAGERSTSRLDRLMKELLDVAGIQLGRMRLVREEVDLLAVVRSALASLRADLQSKGIDVVVHALGPVVGWWDVARLEQVVTNLLSNAIKYGKGSPVGVLLEATDEVATLQVEDRGMGIDPATLPRLFKPFERGVAVGHYGGLGLGLHIADQIVRAHGGEIHARSRPGEGSTFTVQLPRKEPS